MPDNSLPRRLAKRALGRVLGDRAYQWVLAISVVRDIHSRTLREPELDLIARAVRPGEVAVDVGANHGVWAGPLSEAVAPGGRVYAFEPVPFTAGTLRLVLRLLRSRGVVVVEAGCGERAEQVEFSVPIQTTGVTDAAHAHLASRSDESARDSGRWAGARKVSCRLVALDEFLPQSLDVSLLKADIEGAELYALRGATSLIERHVPTVVCEIDPDFLRGFGFAPADVLNFFRERDYSAYRYLQVQRRLVQADDPRLLRSGNYVFVHPRRRQRLEAVLEDPTPEAPPAST